MNTIGTQLRDPINSGLTRWRIAVLNKYMYAAAELGRDPVSKHQIQPEYGDEQTDAGRDCRTRFERPNFQARTRTGKYQFPCSADHVQDWQPYPVDPYSHAICVTIHTYRMARMTGPDCAVMCNLVNKHTHTHIPLGRINASGI